jgi:hypothetical protein
LNTHGSTADSGPRTPPESAESKVTVNIRAGTVPIDVLAITAPIQLQPNSHGTGGLQLDNNELLPVAANPEDLFLIVEIGHINNLCYALVVGVPRRHAPEQAACRLGFIAVGRQHDDDRSSQLVGNPSSTSD